MHNPYLEDSSKRALANISKINDVIPRILQLFNAWVELSLRFVIGLILWQLVKIDVGLGSRGCGVSRVLLYTTQLVTNDTNEDEDDQQGEGDSSAEHDKSRTQHLLHNLIAKYLKFDGIVNDRS